MLPISPKTGFSGFHAVSLPGHSPHPLQKQPTSMSGKQGTSTLSLSSPFSEAQVTVFIPVAKGSSELDQIRENSQQKKFWGHQSDRDLLSAFCILKKAYWYIRHQWSSAAHFTYVEFTECITCYLFRSLYFRHWCGASNNAHHIASTTYVLMEYNKF